MLVIWHLFLIRFEDGLLVAQSVREKQNSAASAKGERPTEEVKPEAKKRLLKLRKTTIYCLTHLVKNAFCSDICRKMARMSQKCFRESPKLFDCLKLWVYLLGGGRGEFSIREGKGKGEKRSGKGEGWKMRRTKGRIGIEMGNKQYERGTA